jgi:hypothetical protein
VCDKVEDKVRWGVPWGILPVNPSTPLIMLMILDIRPVNPLPLLARIEVGDPRFVKTLRFLSRAASDQPVNHPSEKGGEASDWEKLQIPNSKSQKNPKLQAPNQKARRRT